MTTATLLRPPVTAMPAAGPLAAGTPVRSAWVALAGSAASVPPIVLLHLDAPSGLSATYTTISDYVVTTPMGEPLFGMTTGALALAGMAIARGVARSTVVRTLLVGWSVALVIAAVFPTNRPGMPGDTSSTVHLIAGAGVFALLPLVGFLFWRRQRAALPMPWVGPALLTVSVVSGTLSTALILNRVPGVLGLDGFVVPPGMLQRAAGAAEILLAATIALALLPAARRGSPGIAGYGRQAARSAGPWSSTAGVDPLARICEPSRGIH